MIIIILALMLFALSVVHGDASGMNSVYFSAGCVLIALANIGKEQKSDEARKQ